MLFIDWNPSIEAFRIGSFAMRWYALCWLIGLLAAYFIVRRLYIQQKIKETLFEPLFIYCFLGILIGARLGHCLFYEPDYFLSSGQHIVEMLIPIRFPPARISLPCTGSCSPAAGTPRTCSHCAQSWARSRPAKRWWRLPPWSRWG